MRRALGASACLIRSVGDARLPSAAYRGDMRRSTRIDAPKTPAGAVTAEDADLIASLVPQGRVRMRLLLTPQQLPDAVSYNVIGDLKEANIRNRS